MLHPWHVLYTEADRNECPTRGYMHREMVVLHRYHSIPRFKCLRRGHHKVDTMKPCLSYHNASQTQNCNCNASLG